MIDRRTFLGAMLAASGGPAIVRVASLMLVRPLRASPYELRIDEMPSHGYPLDDEIRKWQIEFARACGLPAYLLWGDGCAH